MPKQRAAIMPTFGEALRFKEPPRESLKLDVEIDAADQLEQAKFPATSMGIDPTLASLEMLLYPKSVVAIAIGERREAIARTRIRTLESL